MKRQEKSLNLESRYANVKIIIFPLFCHTKKSVADDNLRYSTYFCPYPFNFFHPTTHTFSLPPMIISSFLNGNSIRVRVVYEVVKRLNYALRPILSFCSSNGITRIITSEPLLGISLWVGKICGVISIYS